jgi:hypothetical protein
MSAQFWFRRPNQLRIKTPLYELTCDGKQVLVYVKKLNQYVIREAPAVLDEAWFQSEPIAQLELPYTLLLPTALAEVAEAEMASEFKRLMPGATRANDLDAPIRKRPCLAVALPRIPANPQFTAARVYVDGERHVVSRVAVQEKGEAAGKWQSWIDVLKLDLDQPIEDKIFVIREPPRAKKTDRFTLAGRPGPPNKPRR